MPSSVLGLCPTPAGQLRADVIGGVGIEPLFQGSCGNVQSLPPRRDLHSLEVQILDRLMAYQRFNFLDDFVLEGSLEPPFLASVEEAVETAASSLSAHCSQASQ